jgi:predicted cupin superfamily sugar epimerase
MIDADWLIAELELVPHPEGGHFRETFRDGPDGNGRAHSTSIYFLLRKGERSRLHRIDAAEVWHWYFGAALELLIGAEGKQERIILGNKFSQGERPQAVVPPGEWQSARSLGDFTLVGCTVAPGFEFSKFEIGKEGAA